MGRPVDPLISLLTNTPTAENLSAPGVWERVLEGAAAEGVAQLIAERIRPVASGEQRAWCDKVLTASWKRHDRAVASLNEIARSLDDADVEFIALKGPALACRQYKPPFLRKPCLDLDLAVRQSDLDAARAALAGMGYTATTSVAHALAYSHHLVMKHPGRMAVELHFRLTHRAMGIAVDECFARSVSFQMPGGCTVKVLNQSDEALQLILHLAQARFDTLFHAFEVRQLWRAATPEIRREVAARAARHGFAGVFRLVTVALQVLWGEAAPAAEAEMKKPWLSARITPALVHQFRASVAPGTTHTVKTRVRAAWLLIQVTDTPADAALLVLSRIRGLFGLPSQEALRPVAKTPQIPIGR